jgi:uncharacterized protein
MYLMGRFVPQNDAEAVKWFRLAADQGNASGQTWLGDMYAKGQGVPQDYVEAVKWYRLAADQSFAPALFELGVMYAKGYGGERDNVQAHMWFDLAASQFTKAYGAKLRDKAVKNRDLVASEMTPTQIAEAQKLAREFALKWHRDGINEAGDRGTGMKALILLVTWIVPGQPPSSYQVTFSRRM